MVRLIALDLNDSASAAADRLAERLGLDVTDVLRLGLATLYRTNFPSTKQDRQPRPAPSSVGPDEDRLAEAIELSEEIADMANQVPSAGQEFAESVSEQTADIIATAKDRNYVTAKQLDALRNMRDGLARWIY